MGQFFLQCLWLLLPFGVANMSPVVFKNQLKVLARPVDNNKFFFGQRIFGDHKTWRGIILGTISGGLTFILQQALYTIPSFQYISLFEYPAIPSLFGFVLGFGALFGDLVRAFFKRRLKIKPGEAWLPLDQIDYTIGGLLFASIYITITWQIALTVILSGFILHIVVSYIGYFLKIKDSLW